MIHKGTAPVKQNKVNDYKIGETIEILYVDFEPMTEKENLEVFEFSNESPSEILDKLEKSHELEIEDGIVGEPKFTKNLIAKFRVRLKYAKNYIGKTKIDLAKIHPKDQYAFKISPEEKVYIQVLISESRIPAVRDVLSNNKEKVKNKINK